VDEEAKQMMESVMRNAKKMGQLIDDLLSFSKIGKKELVYTQINMNQLVENVLQDLKNSLPQFATKITVKPLNTISGDYNLISLVLTNLISNAIKYSSAKQNPEIEIGVENENNSIVFYVKDNGAGFDMKYYDKLFGVFQRLHADNEFEGTGVGLALVKRIISRHSGKIWANAKLNEGATFYFSLSTN
jgi:light-regulated signal transduction histidine kinase (bacteriophytochrome)